MDGPIWSVSARTCDHGELHLRSGAAAGSTLWLNQGHRPSIDQPYRVTIFIETERERSVAAQLSIILLTVTSRRHRWGRRPPDARRDSEERWSGGRVSANKKIIIISQGKEVSCSIDHSLPKYAAGQKKNYGKVHRQLAPSHHAAPQKEIILCRNWGEEEETIISATMRNCQWEYTTVVEVTLLLWGNLKKSSRLSGWLTKLIDWHLVACLFECGGVYAIHLCDRAG